MKRFFCLQTIAFCRYENDETSGQDLPISDGHDIVDMDALQELARQGDVEAQCRLAYCLYSGRFVKRVGNRIETIRRDVGGAFYWWSMAARQGNANAQHWLGRCYYYGEGPSTNRPESIRYFRYAAEQGIAEAQFYLGICYWEGEDIEENRDEAIRWLRRAAEQGQREAILFLERHGIAITDTP